MRDIFRGMQTLSRCSNMKLLAILWLFYFTNRKSMAEVKEISSCISQLEKILLNDSYGSEVQYAQM